MGYLEGLARRVNEVTKALWDKKVSKVIKDEMDSQESLADEVKMVLEDCQDLEVCLEAEENKVKKSRSKTAYKSVSYQAATWLLSCGGDGITSRWSNVSSLASISPTSMSIA